MAPHFNCSMTSVVRMARWPGEVQSPAWSPRRSRRGDYNDAFLNVP